VLTVELYLLNGHTPSANVGRIVDLYLKSCPGVVLRRNVIKSRQELQEVMGKRKVKDVPALDVPGEFVHGKRKRLLLTDAEEIEKWCKETVQQIDSANRGRRRR
jgi:hypothetical protein